MTSTLPHSLLNTSYIDVINHYSGEAYIYLLQIFQLFSTSSSDIKEPLKEWYKSLAEFFVNFIEFDNFQIKILKALLTTLLCNILLIFILWKFFGPQICDRFMRPATSRAIEELKASVARLKLPKVHSPINK